MADASAATVHRLARAEPVVPISAGSAHPSAAHSVVARSRADRDRRGLVRLAVAAAADRRRGRGHGLGMGPAVPDRAIRRPSRSAAMRADDSRLAAERPCSGRRGSGGGRGGGVRGDRDWRSGSSVAGAALVFVIAAREHGADPIWLASARCGSRCPASCCCGWRSATGPGAPRCCGCWQSSGRPISALMRFGSRIGGPRLAPRWSPRKTWAGLLGGIFCAALAGWATARLLGWLGGSTAGDAERGTCDRRSVRRSCGVRWPREGSA